MNTSTKTLWAAAFCVPLITSSFVATAAGTHTGAFPASHMELKDDNGSIVCFAYDTSATTAPVAANCPNGTYTEQLFNSGWSQIGNRTVTIEDTPPSSGGTHTGASPATHMELKDDSGSIVCYAYDTAASSSPVAANCPSGTYTEQLFNSGWGQIGNRTVTIGDPPPSSDGTHVGASPATHMELKDASGTVVCYAYNTSASSAPIATDCPNGTYTEQLFDSGWGQIGNRTVTIGGSIPDGTEAVARNSNDLFNHSSSINIDELNFVDSAFTQSVNDPSLSADLRGYEYSGNPDDNANFRVLCQWSHFNYDDPILDQSDTAHLHMYFGNTDANAETRSDENESNFIARRGGGTCSGFGINRSAYWTPALMKGEAQAIVPREIIVYYKTKTVCEEVGLIPPDCDTYRNGGTVNPPRVSHTPADVVEMPQGLQLISGNNGNVRTDLNVRMNSTSLTDNSELLFWSCGKSGSVTQEFNRIPTDEEWQSHGCKNDDYLNATVYFPQCWKGDVDGDGIDLNDLTSGNGRDHVVQRQSDEACPDGHQRLPQLGFLLYWDLKDFDDSTDDLRLSSDKGQSTLDADSNLHPGGTLHADWIAGWHDETMDLWTEHCLKAGRNCTFGQTGTDRKLRHEPTNVYNGHAGVSFGPAGSYIVNTPHGSHKH